MTETKITYYHGGDRGLHVGDYILPQSETGAEYAPHELHQKDRAYITPSIDAAYYYGSKPWHKNPVVYVVKPEGDIEPDPDCKVPGGSFSCQKAKIIAMKKVPGKVIKKNRKAIVRLMHEIEAKKKLEAAK
jgi:hypothetical protein